MPVESKNYRFYKDGKSTEIYLDISFKLVGHYHIYLIIKSPVETIIYSTTYIFSFKYADFHNFSFTNSKCQLIGTEWVSFNSISNSLFYIIANHEIKNIKFELMMNYSNSFFTTSNSELESLKNDCNTILKVASGKISIPKDIGNGLPSPSDYSTNSYNLQSKYGRRMMRRQVNSKYESGSNEYRSRINFYNNILGFVVFLVIVIFFILKNL